jgi:hypothetical protein
VEMRLRQLQQGVHVSFTIYPEGFLPPRLCNNITQHSYISL